MEQTIEQKVSAAILQKTLAEIEICGISYKIAPPTLGTLIEVSEIVSTLPVVEKVPKNEVVSSVLKNARHFKALGKIASILILGAKPVTDERIIIESDNRFPTWFRKRKKRIVKVNLQEELAKQIIDNVSPSTLFDVIIKRLKDMEVGTFFAITTSLSEANILKPTKEEVVL